MSKWYKLIYKQTAPIHIGSNSHGVVNETRIFIPGITMWGALTNAFFKNSGDHEETLFEKITCFYPTIDNRLLEPNFKDGEFHLGDKSESLFRKEFTSTYLATAIDPTGKNAADESLHEIDIILPKDISWTGYLNIEDEDKIPNEIYIGGDSRYGFGRMVLEDKNEEDFSYEVKKSMYQDENYPQNQPLKNYLKFQNQKFEGKLELLAEFDFSSSTPSIKPDNYTGYFLTPGTIIRT